jgi:hypothetical protein
MHISEDEVREMRVETLESGLGGGHAHDAIPEGGEIVREHLSRGGIVFDHQDHRRMWPCFDRLSGFTA